MICPLCQTNKQRTEFSWLRDGNGGHRSEYCKQCAPTIAQWNRRLGKDGLTMKRGTPQRGSMSLRGRAHAN